MARSLPQAPLAFVAEVARYLSVDPEDVKRMIQLDGMPAIKIPLRTRPVFRVHLRELHAWLLKRATSTSPELARYETFLSDFDSIRASRLRKGEGGGKRSDGESD